MKNVSSLLSVLLVAAALAGCANNGGDADTNVTTNTTTPAATSPATTTPMATPTLAPPNGTEDNETPPAPLECPESPVAPANETTLLGYPQITFTVSENATGDGCYHFVGPANATAGWTAITLQNNGRAPHIMPMYFIGEHTLEEAEAILHGDAAPPEWAVPVGGVGIATPFSNGTAIMNLTAGNYVIVCFFEGHHFQGMYRLLTVEAAEDNATAAAEPTANATIEMNDFSYAVPNMTAGLQIVKIVNNGTQPHEAPVIALQGNTTMQQFMAAMSGQGAGGPPPGAGVGGLNVIAPGEHAYIVLDLESGATYGLVCFVEDPASHAPHFTKGMIGEFTVA